VTLIFIRRLIQRLSVPTIAWRLNWTRPPGDGPGWTETRVAAILRNPKYTGHMVYGRTCKLPASRKPGPSRPGVDLVSRAAVQADLRRKLDAVIAEQDDRARMAAGA